MKKELEKEQTRIKAWRTEAERELSERLHEGTVEITEEYDEKKEEEWRKEHRKKVKHHFQSLAKDKSKNAEAQKTSTEDEKELWDKLDQLELEEELAQYRESQRKVKAKSEKLEKRNSIAAASQSSQSQNTPNPEKPSILKSKQNNDIVKEMPLTTVPVPVSEKRKVSFDQSKDTTHTYIKENKKGNPETFNVSPSTSSQPHALVTDFVKDIVVERNPNFAKAGPDNKEMASFPVEPMSSFKQEHLAQNVSEAVKAKGAGDGPPEANSAKRVERVSLFKQKQMQKQNEGN